MALNVADILKTQPPPRAAAGPATEKPSGYRFSAKTLSAAPRPPALKTAPIAWKAPPPPTPKSAVWSPAPSPPATLSTTTMPPAPTYVPTAPVPENPAPALEPTVFLPQLQPGGLPQRFPARLDLDLPDSLGTAANGSNRPRKTQ